MSSQTHGDNSRPGRFLINWVSLENWQPRILAPSLTKRFKSTIAILNLIAVPCINSEVLSDSDWKAESDRSGYKVTKHQCGWEWLDVRAAAGLRLHCLLAATPLLLPDCRRGRSIRKCPETILATVSTWTAMSATSQGKGKPSNLVFLARCFSNV